MGSLHLDSYYTKYGFSDGITTNHLGNSKSNAPGLLIYGPTRDGAWGLPAPPFLLDD